MRPSDRRRLPRGRAQDPEHVEDSMTEFVQGGVAQGTEDRVDRVYAQHRRLSRGHILPELADIFVADRYFVIAIESICLSVTSLQRHKQKSGKPERAEESLQLLKRAFLL